MNSINSDPQNTQNNKYSPEKCLIQNFYIIGFSPEDFFKVKVNEKEKIGEFENIFKDIKDIPKLIPKLITKFPNNKSTLNLIPDEIVISHCFPNGELNIFQKSKGNDYPKTSFQFELDNKHHNYNNEDERLYSKIYFSCLEIGEPISDYFLYRKEILNLIFKYNSIKLLNYDKNNIENNNISEQYSEYVIPKVICFASVLPFYNELNYLLQDIFDYYISYKNFSSLPLEKVIEKIVTEIPLPLKFGTELSVNFKTPNYKDKITFPLFNSNELNIKYSANMPLVDLFKYFSVDDIIHIFKLIIYEIPILFFSKDKSVLSLLVDTFLTVLSPFKYVYPHISILPNKLFGLIDSEIKFIFGINQSYTREFFKSNNIELDKTVVAIDINIEDKIKKIAKINFHEKIFDDNKFGKYQIHRKGLIYHYDETVLVGGIKTNIINIDIPNIYKKLLTEGLNKYISFMKKKSFFSKKESVPKDFNLKIQNVFYKFFINILSGYTEFLINTPSFYSNERNVGEKIFFRHKDNFIKEVFKTDDFVIKAPKDSQTFFVIISKTKFFQTFFYERMYNNNIIDKLATRQFDLLTYLKKHADYRKKKENKSLFDNFKKDILEKIKVEKKDEININDENPFPNEFLKGLIKEEENNIDILMEYGQLIKMKDSSGVNNIQGDLSKLIDIKYCIFPKLNFKYFDSNKKVLPFINSSYINSFKCSLKIRNEDYEKQRPYICFENQFIQNNNLNNNNINDDSFQIPQKTYINYIWLILISSSLWYCLEEEKNYRQDKIFELLSKMEYIEEYVLDIIFINLYYYGDKLHFVKMYMIYNRMKGYTNYYFLNLLCDKIRQKENDIKENEIINIDDEEEQSDLVLSKRYLIKISDEFERKRKVNPKKSSDIEEIIFSTEQICQTCKEITDINPNEIINQKCNLNEDNYKYKCNKCKTDEIIKIKYQELLYNYSTQEGFFNKTGEFQMLTPYKLYCNLKNYFIEENDIKIDIKNIFDIENKINLINILFYFSTMDLHFDFLLPYTVKLTSSMTMLLKNMVSNNIKEKELVRITYKDKDEVSHGLRKFNNITPQYNIKKRNKFLGINMGLKYIETDLSFTVKNSKKKGKK